MCLFLALHEKHNSKTWTGWESKAVQTPTVDPVWVDL